MADTLLADWGFYLVASICYNQFSARNKHYQLRGMAEYLTYFLVFPKKTTTVNVAVKRLANRSEKNEKSLLAGYMAELLEIYWIKILLPPQAEEAP